MSGLLRGAIWLVLSFAILGCQDKTPAEIVLIAPGLSPMGVLVARHENVSLEVGAKNKNGETLDDIRVAYSSSHPDIIEISPEGILWCKKHGHVDVTVMAEEIGIMVPVECVDSRVVGFGNLFTVEEYPELSKLLTKQLIRTITNSK